MTLKEKLISEGKTRWLDVGNGQLFERGFHFLDILPIERVPHHSRDKFFQKNFLELTKDDFVELGKFDLVRFKYVYEHFDFEEGLKVLENAAKLLNPGGMVIIIVPDLRKHIDKYLNNDYQSLEYFSDWAKTIIPEGAPASFYFSINAYGVEHLKHKWLYDFEGLKFQLERSALFTDIQEIKPTDELASDHFTYNRANEDVTIVAKVTK